MNFTRAIIPCSTIKKWYDLYLGTHWAVATMGDKSVETLGSKIRFQASGEHFPLPTMLIFPFSQHRSQLLHNIELWGWGYQKINARCK